MEQKKKLVFISSTFSIEKNFRCLFTSATFSLKLFGDNFECKWYNQRFSPTSNVEKHENAVDLQFAVSPWDSLVRLTNCMESFSYKHVQVPKSVIIPSLKHNSPYHPYSPQEIQSLGLLCQASEGAVKERNLLSWSKKANEWNLGIVHQTHDKIASDMNHTLASQ